MNVESLKEAVELGKRMKHVYVATADLGGFPHLATAGSVEMVSDDQIAVEEWFCPGTVENVRENPLVSVVSWDSVKDVGFQILGNVEKTEEIAIMDGFSPEIEKGPQMPQSERRLLVRVHEVLSFSRGPHSDTAK
jgi:uncharacterized protein